MVERCRPVFLKRQWILSVLIMSCLIASTVLARSRPGFTNPILAGFHPDPSICRVGSNYYLVNSTFGYYPGIPVYESRDLVNWRLISYVIDRPAELKYDGLPASEGIFAPSIRYHNGKYFITCDFNRGGGIFVATASNPAGPWSDPAWLHTVRGGDPSLFFDDNGEAYLVYSAGVPRKEHAYEGEGTIRMYRFDIHTLSVVGKDFLLVKGGANIEDKPKYIEGPHIFKSDGYYYLIAAQGGTEEHHSEVVFRSKNVTGPYLSYQENPILTQRDLDPDRTNPVTCTGHADFVKTQRGKWWAVFLGCQPYQPYQKDYYNTGRETFLAPVHWKGGWPGIVSHGREVRHHYVYPLQPDKEFAVRAYGGSFSYLDDFDSDSLDPNWEFLRAPLSKWYSLKEKPGFLAVEVMPETCSGKTNPSFIARRQQHAVSSVSTALEFTPRGANEKAGLLVFQNESHFYYLCESNIGGRLMMELYRPGKGKSMNLIASRAIPDLSGRKEVYLRIECDGLAYSFYYGIQRGRWKQLMKGVDASFLSTNVAGGFLGCMYALYATSLGMPSQSTAYYDWFKYTGKTGTKK